MLPLQKNNDVIEKLVKAMERLGSLNGTKETFFTFLVKINTLEKTHAKKIWNSMTEFQDRIVKLTFYSSQKVKRILNFTKIYKQFSHHWQKISKVNIKNLQQLQTNQIESSEKVVRQKAQQFLQELGKYISEEKGYNEFFVKYKAMCSNLKEDIQKFKSYSDPLCFYNEKFTSQFLEKLKRKYDRCIVEQTRLKTETQTLDQKRHYLSYLLAQVKEAYVPTFEKILKTLYLGIRHIIDPKKDEAIQKEDFKLAKNQGYEKQFYKGQVESLLGTQSNGVNLDDDQNNIIVDDFKELFQGNQFTKNQITSDQKFFFDRCENIKTKKVKRSNQILAIQKLLIGELKTQISNLKQFQCDFKKIQKEIFGSDGAQTFSKKFRKYYGKNFHELYELCTQISQKRKSSIQKIYRIIENCEQKLDSTFKQKKDKLKFFENRANYVLEIHKKIKERAETNNFSNQDLIKQFKTNVVSTYEDFSKNYKDLQNSQDEMDKIFFKNLQQISDLILREAVNKSLSKIIEKEKNRVEIFRQLKLQTQAQTNFYEDTKYQVFFSEQIQPTLSKNFKSQINTKQFQETKSTLMQKQYALNGMIRHKVTCCGVKSQLLTQNLKQSFQCYLINMKKNKKKTIGSLNIMSNGISFTQKSLNPFSNLLQIVLPSRDIDSYKTQVIEGTSVLTVNSKKGAIYFYGDSIANIHNAMLETLGVKMLQKEMSEKNSRNHSSSSSFLGNSGSQSFRLQFQKSTSTSMNRINNKQNQNRTPKKSGPQLSKAQSSSTNKLKKLSSCQLFSPTEVLTKIEIKLLSTHFLSQNFTEIEKQLPIKDPSRFNYNYKNGIHKFLLKQKKRSQINGKVLSFDYSWKVSFPDNVLLKSFKHYETVYVELEKNLTKIKIVHGVNFKNVSLAQKVFYDQIAMMNHKLTTFIVECTEREAEVIIEPDAEEDMESEVNLESLDTNDIKINLDRQMTSMVAPQKPFITCQSFFKNQRLQKSSSNFTMISNKS